MAKLLDHWWAGKVLVFMLHVRASRHCVGQRALSEYYLRMRPFDPPFGNNRVPSVHKCLTVGHELTSIFSARFHLLGEPLWLSAVSVKNSRNNSSMNASWRRPTVRPPSLRQRRTLPQRRRESVGKGFNFGCRPGKRPGFFNRRLRRPHPRRAGPKWQSRSREPGCRYRAAGSHGR